MNGFSEKGLELQEQVQQFMDDFIYPNEEEYYAEYAGPRQRPRHTGR